ncbi:bifunctional acetate--CoA ligase family protein/GNAT family N-acetyltransferase [Dichotomicrobium thermohalophilum]|uniref:Acetyltransferase n=1 Tax=Dichotomicrobium thermohalophilum TaxID=933063 RepID=A0A397QDP2_9HYPH|nr:bifunctional acetate--CoA ligase family protein/GNAT family N-acetyltransferase [Dichotomicrobium thermohalophilum]RIA56371.1 acetyltransferase [Dichotomicrobium thermohalophilum]
MTIHNLDYLFRPSSVALFGASERPGSVGATVAANLLSGGFNGPVWFVNPKHKNVQGQPCYASTDELPGTPDLAVIAIPAQAVPELIAALGNRGCRAAIVLTAGIEGELETRMLEAARPHGLRILGPNCIGLLMGGSGLNASFSHTAPIPGDLAIVSQSGALLTSVLDWANGRQIGFSLMASVGNMADIDFGDMLDYLAGDVSSKAILLYVEGIKNAPKFMSAARRAARSKPVIVIKTGRHETAAQAAASHTGALAGSDKVYDAAFRRAGVLRVPDLDELFIAAETAERIGTIPGERLTILTNGGGAGVLAADALADEDGELSELSDDTTAKLHELLPETWSGANPVDIIGDAGPDRYKSAMSTLLADPETEAILVMNCPTALASSEDTARAVIEAVNEQRQAGRSAPVVTNWLGSEASAKAREMFAENNIPSFETPRQAVRGFMHLVHYSRAQKELMRAPPMLPRPLSFDSETAQKQIDDVVKSGRSMMTEPEAKRLLQAYNVPIVPAFEATTPEDVREAAEEILRDYSSVVLKILSHDISHKSDVGGVRLDISSAERAAKAAEEMMERIGKERPDARIEGISVQPMIHGKLAHELIVGMTEDQTFGPVILFGAGGTAVEVVKDTAMALPPLDLKLANDLIRETRISRLLRGYRDRPAADMDSIALTLVKVSYLIAQHPEIRELDINPLRADENGAVALDARVVLADQNKSPRTPMAIRPYPHEWEKTITLEGFGEVFIRPIRPDDEKLYEEMIQRMDQNDLRLRFFSPQRHLSRKFLARLTQIDYGREIAFVALTPSEDEMLGVARFFADPDYRKAEYAVMTRSDLKGRGLGWQLMRHLIDYAKAEGLERLYGSVLSENVTMLRMCQQLGFNTRHDPEDPSIFQVELPLNPSPESGD